jgi:hypothetical protein
MIWDPNDLGARFFRKVLSSFMKRWAAKRPAAKQLAAKRQGAKRPGREAEMIKKRNRKYDC